MSSNNQRFLSFLVGLTLGIFSVNYDACRSVLQFSSSRLVFLESQTSSTNHLRLEQQLREEAELDFMVLDEEEDGNDVSNGESTTETSPNNESAANSPTSTTDLASSVGETAKSVSSTVATTVATTTTTTTSQTVSTPSAKPDTTQTTQTPVVEPPPTVRNKNIDSTINITAAVCHKTLFGDVNLHNIAQWAMYHYMLGFDRVFIGYIADVTNRTGFADLQATPYITMYENTLGQVKVYPDGYVRMKRPGPGDQNWDIRHCLQKVGKPYDWVMPLDSDEFLWFHQKVGVKEFLLQHKDLNYISFGKYIYSAHIGVELTDYNDDEFGLAQVRGVGPTFFVHEWRCAQGMPRLTVSCLPKSLLCDSFRSQ